MGQVPQREADRSLAALRQLLARPDGATPVDERQ